MKQMYRGYDLEKLQNGKWTVSKDGKKFPVTIANEEAAHAWIDAHKRVNPPQSTS